MENKITRYIPFLSKLSSDLLWYIWRQMPLCHEQACHWQAHSGRGVSTANGLYHTTKDSSKVKIVKKNSKVNLQ